MRLFYYFFRIIFILRRSVKRAFSTLLKGSFAQQDLEKNAGEAVLGRRKRGRIFSSGASGACGTSGVEFSPAFFVREGRAKKRAFFSKFGPRPGPGGAEKVKMVVERLPIVQMKALE